MNLEPATTLGEEEQVRLAGPDYNLRGRGVCPLRIRARSDSAIWPAQDLGRPPARPRGRGGLPGRGGAGRERRGHVCTQARAACAPSAPPPLSEPRAAPLAATARSAAQRAGEWAPNAGRGRMGTLGVSARAAVAREAAARGRCSALSSDFRVPSAPPGHCPPAGGSAVPACGCPPAVQSPAGRGRCPAVIHLSGAAESCWPRRRLSNTAGSSHVLPGTDRLLLGHRGCNFRPLL